MAAIPPEGGLHSPEWREKCWRAVGSLAWEEQEWLPEGEGPGDTHSSDPGLVRRKVSLGKSGDSLKGTPFY